MLGINPQQSVSFWQRRSANIDARAKFRRGFWARAILDGDSSANDVDRAEVTTWGSEMGYLRVIRQRISEWTSERRQRRPSSNRELDGPGLRQSSSAVSKDAVDDDVTHQLEAIKRAIECEIGKQQSSQA